MFSPEGSSGGPDESNRELHTTWAQPAGWRNVAMRKGFWMFSASAVIAGGMALSAGLCAETKMLPTSEATAAPAPAAAPNPTHPLSLEISGDESPKPFVRKKAAATPAPRKNVRQLFGDRKAVADPPAGHLEIADIEEETSKGAGN